MEKKTDKSPVEQMREWLQAQKDEALEGHGDYWMGKLTLGGMALAKMNELFPEVQQVPIQPTEDKCVYFIENPTTQYWLVENKSRYNRFFEWTNNPHKAHKFSSKEEAQTLLEMANLDKIAIVTEHIFSSPQVPIQDIDALAEKYVKSIYSYNQGGRRIDGTRDYKAGYRQCLEDRGSDAIAFAEWILHNADTDSNMWSYFDTDDTYKPKTTEQLYQLWQHSKNKQ